MLNPGCALFFVCKIQLKKTYLGINVSHARLYEYTFIRNTIEVALSSPLLLLPVIARKHPPHIDTQSAELEARELQQPGEESHFVSKVHQLQEKIVSFLMSCCNTVDIGAQFLKGYQFSF